MISRPPGRFFYGGYHELLRQNRRNLRGQCAGYGLPDIPRRAGGRGSDPEEMLRLAESIIAVMNMIKNNVLRYKKALYRNESIRAPFVLLIFKID